MVLLALLKKSHDPPSDNAMIIWTIPYTWFKGNCWELGLGGPLGIQTLSIRSLLKEPEVVRAQKLRVPFEGSSLIRLGNYLNPG